MKNELNHKKIKLVRGNHIKKEEEDFYSLDNTKWSEEDKGYLAKYYDFDEIDLISYALSRKEKAVKQRYHELRKAGKIEAYREYYDKLIK
ncbi:hypothetical protein [Priestia koreensis]|uniref:hypothetical protein n=1 Tax=Priestia koreensis TaxID=284581 RepID=UPI00203F52C8|nr:hypothetical protein [Priestia koreensis]MCM3005862.1 hypothetical protein [Priestia koreensis]